MMIMYGMEIFGVNILNAKIDMVGVAVIHTMFNLVTTVVLFPIKKLIIKFCTKIIPDGKEEQHTALFGNMKIIGIIIS